MSRPVRGAWIETDILPRVLLGMSRRAPSGARGLKLDAVKDANIAEEVAPRPGRVD